jgi:hypothetical protein
MKTSHTEEKSVLEKALFENDSWGPGYVAFTKIFGKPLGWLYVIREGGHRLIRLNQKGNCLFFSKSLSNQQSCTSFVEKYFDQLKMKPEETHKLPLFYRCGFGRPGIIFGMQRMGQLKGFLILCGVGKREKEIKPFINIFNQFLQAQVDLAYKSFELQNFYETVHPRALALSTIHSVHRVMASSLRLNELLPRIGRLCAQVLKAKKCAVYLIDSSGKYLIPKFSFGDEKEKKRKLLVGKGVEGHVAETAEFYLTRSCVAVPFIEDDVAGVVILKDKIGNTPFTKTDLEILKTLSEQAVVAIKNAQLFEETEEITLSSVKTINELLALSFSGNDIYIPVFGQIVYRIGVDMRLIGNDLTNLHRATFLIDAGHLGTPEHILCKKEKLTKEEFEEVKQHPHRGAAILQQISALRPVIPIILHHHERFDGTGYPHQLKGEEIPIGARIIAVVDSFMAMISRRRYRRVLNVDEGIQEIKSNSSTQFDPKVVESFLKIVRQPDIMEQLKKLSKNDIEVVKKGEK